MGAKTIVVTGAAGFIGSYLAKRLVGDGCRVIGIDNMCPYYDVDLKRLRLEMLSAYEGADERFYFIEGDIADEELLGRVFAEESPRIVVNLAAQAGVRYSIDHPKSYIDSNIVGFYSVLEACRHHGVEHLVYASSSSVYGTGLTAPYSPEQKTDNPVSLYAATKLANEHMAAAYANLYGFACTGLRFFTVYGPMGRPDMAYFKFAERMRKGEPIELYNYGDMLRDFTYIDDVVEGLVRVINTPIEAGWHPVHNIGHGSPVTLREFVETLEGCLRDAGAIDGEVVYELKEMQPGDVYMTHADTTSFAQSYGFVPQVGLAEGLGEFARWYAEWRS